MGRRIAKGFINQSALKTPGNFISATLSLVFLSIAFSFAWYGVLDNDKPITVTSMTGKPSLDAPGMMEITVDGIRHRYCPGQRFGFIHDKYSYALDPVEIPPDGFNNSVKDGQPFHRVFLVPVQDYFWKDPNGFTFRAEWRFRCNTLQGTIFPEVIVPSPDVVMAAK